MIQWFSFHCRSLFVPYFKYLLDGCVQYLVHAGDTKPGLVRKKKTKLHEASNNSKDRDVGLSLEMWHLRALILSSLHKCFLYDTGSLKFLDSSNFQARMHLTIKSLLLHVLTTLLHCKYCQILSLMRIKFCPFLDASASGLFINFFFPSYLKVKQSI